MCLFTVYQGVAKGEGGGVHSHQSPRTVSRGDTWRAETTHQEEAILGEGEINTHQRILCILMLRVFNDGVRTHQPILHVCILSCPNCPSCPATVIQMGWATLEVWAKKEKQQLNMILYYIKLPYFLEYSPDLELNPGQLTHPN